MRVDDGVFDEIMELSSNELPVTPFDEDYDLVCIIFMDRRCFEESDTDKNIAENKMGAAPTD